MSNDYNFERYMPLHEILAIRTEAATLSGVERENFIYWEVARCISSCNECPRRVQVAARVIWEEEKQRREDEEKVKKKRDEENARLEEKQGWWRNDKEW